MRIAVIDDLEKDRERLSILIEEVLKKYNCPFLIECYSSAEDFLEVFKRESFDLCFMDIFMDGMNGMEASQKIALMDPECRIIFLTTSMEYLAQGYNVRAWRYLIKPVDAQIIGQVLPECIEQAELNKRRLSIRLNGRNYEIPYSKILYIVRVKRNIEIHLRNRTVTLSSTQSFQETTEDVLKDYRFILSCKGVVVNMAHVSKLEKADFIMDNGDRIPVSQRRLSAVTDTYLNFVFEYL